MTSDHLPSFFVLDNVLNHTFPTHFTNIVRQMNDTNFDSFKTKISSVDWLLMNLIPMCCMIVLIINWRASMRNHSQFRKRLAKYLKINTNHGLQLPS